MKKILVFTSLFGEPFFGGAEATIFEFYQSLAEEPYQIVICTLDKKYSNKFYKEFNNLSLRRFSTYLPHPVMGRKQTNFVIKTFLHILNLTIGLRPLTVAKEFKRLKPDLVITHNLSGWGMFPWIVCRAMGIPLIHDNHDFYLNCLKTTRWKPEKGVCNKTCKSCLPRSFATKLFWGGGLMITNSLFLQKSVRELLTKQVNTDYEIIYPPVKINRQSIKSLDIKYDAVFIGRLEESKGITEFLNATNFTNYKIAVAGVGELMDKLKIDFPEVHFLGQVDSLDLMAKSRLVVVPSKCNETFGRVVLEGVAMGLPVLHSSRGALAEFKNRKGATLIEINPENLVELANQIKSALKLEKNVNQVETRWLEEHYEVQISKFKVVVNNLLKSNENA
jgi:glycosyltransferase involved in cell wall biosynthesis